MTIDKAKRQLESQHNEPVSVGTLLLEQVSQENVGSKSVGEVGVHEGIDERELGSTNQSWVDPGVADSIKKVSQIYLAEPICIVLDEYLYLSYTRIN